MLGHTRNHPGHRLRQRLHATLGSLTILSKMSHACAWLYTAGAQLCVQLGSPTCMTRDPREHAQDTLPDPSRHHLTAHHLEPLHFCLQHLHSAHDVVVVQLGLQHPGSKEDLHGQIMMFSGMLVGWSRLLAEEVAAIIRHAPSSSHLHMRLVSTVLLRSAGLAARQTCICAWSVGLAPAVWSHNAMCGAASFTRRTGLAASKREPPVADCRCDRTCRDISSSASCASARLSTS